MAPVVKNSLLQYSAAIVGIAGIMWQIHLAEVRIIQTVTTSAVKIEEHAKADDKEHDVVEKRIEGIERRLSEFDNRQYQTYRPKR